MTMYKKTVLLILLALALAGAIYYSQQKKARVAEAKKSIPEFLINNRKNDLVIAPKSAIGVIETRAGEILGEGVSYEIKGGMLDGTKFASNQAQANGWIAMAGTKQDTEKKYTVIHFQKYNPIQYMYVVVQEFKNERTRITIVPVKQ